MGFLHREQQNDDEGSIEFSLAGLFKIMCCVHPKPSDERQQLASIANSLDILKKRFETIEAYVVVFLCSSLTYHTVGKIHKAADNNTV